MTERRLKRRQQLLHRPNMTTITRIRLRRRTSRHRHHKLLTHQRTTTAIRPTSLQHHILPLLQQSRRTIPIKRKLQHNTIMRLNQRLLTSHINHKIRILRILINHRHTINTSSHIHKRTIHPRPIQMRMKHQNQRPQQTLLTKTAKTTLAIVNITRHNTHTHALADPQPQRTPYRRNQWHHRRFSTRSRL